MKNFIQQLATDIAQSPTTAKNVAGITGGVGIATVLEWLSFGMGLAASFAGFALTILMYKKHKLEYLKLKRDFNEKKERNGAHTRRDD